MIRKMGDPMRVALLVVLVCFGWFFSIGSSSAGDADPIYKTCVKLCEKTGCINDTCFQDCRLSNGVAADCPWYMKETQLKGWNCRSECHYHCTVEREKERNMLGLEPVKYHGKWSFKRVLVLQLKDGKKIRCTQRNY